MKHCSIITIALIIFSSTFFSQETDDFTIKLSGYVKTDLIYDSRQTVSVREGHLLLYPQNRVFDQNQNDINAQPNFNILSIQSRVNAKMTGPNALGAKTSSVIEAEFFGHSNSDINGFRLRLAFIKLQWSNTSLIVGQFWHPLFITDVFANVVSFNTGIPFQPFSRNPQVRLQHNFGNLNLTATAYTQRDFSSPGPDGTTSDYMRNSGLPGFNLNAMVKYPNFLFGVGGDFKTLRPRLITAENHSTEESIKSYACVAFAKYQNDKFTFKVEGTYGGNLNDLLMLGGYAVYEQDPVTGVQKYTPLNVLSFWTDISYGKQTEVGIFVGYADNKGTDKSFSEHFSRGINIAYLYRVSPRVIFNFDSFRIAGELEYTIASYGQFNSKGTVDNSEEVGNLRVLTAVYLFF